MSGPLAIGAVSAVLRDLLDNGLIAAGSAVEPLLFQTSVHDPTAFAAAAAVLFAVALLASVVPTRRAARVDPIVALRSD